MILINLLPQELRVSEKKQVDLPYKYVFVSVFLIVIAVSVYQLLIFLNLRSELRELKKTWTPLAQGSMQADMLERELSTTIKAEFDFYDSHVRPSLETAQVMNLISDLLPEGVWLVQFQFVRDRKEIQLILNGLSESKGKESKLVEIQNFANTLRDRLEEAIFPEIKPDAVKLPLETKPAILSNLPMPAFYVHKGKKIELTVTTTSNEKPSETGKREPLIQFVATFKTDGFGAQKVK